MNLHNSPSERNACYQNGTTRSPRRCKVVFGRSLSMHFVMSSAPALHDELQCIHNLTKRPGFLTGDAHSGESSLGRVVDGSGIRALDEWPTIRPQRDLTLPRTPFPRQLHNCRNPPKQP